MRSFHYRCPSNMNKETTQLSMETPLCVSQTGCLAGRRRNISCGNFYLYRLEKEGVFCLWPVLKDWNVWIINRIQEGWLDKIGQVAKLMQVCHLYINPLMPNDPYRGRTAPLTSKRCILYIFSTNIGTEYFKHGMYSPFFSLQNAVCFIILTYLLPVLVTFYIQVC